MIENSPPFKYYLTLVLNQLSGGLYLEIRAGEEQLWIIYWMIILPLKMLYLRY